MVGGGGREEFTAAGKIGTARMVTSQLFGASVGPLAGMVSWYVIMQRYGGGTVGVLDRSILIGTQCVVPALCF